MECFLCRNDEVCNLNGGLDVSTTSTIYGSRKRTVVVSGEPSAWSARTVSHGRLVASTSTTKGMRLGTASAAKSSTTKTTYRMKTRTHGGGAATATSRLPLSKPPAAIRLHSALAPLPCALLMEFNRPYLNPIGIVDATRDSSSTTDAK